MSATIAPQRLPSARNGATRRRDRRLHRDVARQHDDRHAAAEHRVCRLRIDIDVELGGRRDVAALEERAAHQHDFAQRAANLWRFDQRGRDVRQRAERAQRHAVRRRAAQRIDEVRHRMAGRERRARLVQFDTFEPRLAVHVRGRHELAHERARAACIDGQRLRAAGPVADDPRIAFGQVERHVARDGGQRAHVEPVLRAEREQDRDGVVLARIGIDDHRAARGVAAGGERARFRQQCGAGQRGGQFQEGAAGCDRMGHGRAQKTCRTPSVAIIWRVPVERAYAKICAWSASPAACCAITVSATSVRFDRK